MTATGAELNVLQTRLCCHLLQDIRDNRVRSSPVILRVDPQHDTFRILRDNVVLSTPFLLIQGNVQPSTGVMKHEHSKDGSELSFLVSCEQMIPVAVRQGQAFV